MMTKRPPGTGGMKISGERPEDDDDDDDDEKAGASMNTDGRPKDDDKEAGDKYLNIGIIMNIGTNDADNWLNVRGDWTANLSANPLFDTREYKIESTDVIIGNQILHLQEITDHKRDNSAVPISEGTGHGAN
jgi:hypothetical protein